MGVSLRRLRHGHLRGIQHIFNENAVPHGGIVYHNVGYSTDELAVLNDRAARHECGQEGTTHFNGKFKKAAKSEGLV